MRMEKKRVEIREETFVIYHESNLKDFRIIKRYD